MAKKPKLSDLIRRAAEDTRLEPAFFHALLKSDVYSHVPIDDPVTRSLRFTMFNHPETGEQLLPFFTDRGKAEFAAAGMRRVVKLPGRVFLEATLGATLMVNPNDERGAIYPEEVRQLLLTGKVAQIKTFMVEHEGDLLVAPLEPVPDWLREALKAALTPLVFVVTAYVAKVRGHGEESHERPMVALGTLDGFGERAMRALTTALQPELARRRCPLDSMHFQEPGGRPGWVESLRLSPVYQRAMDTPGRTYPGGDSTSVN